MPAILDKEICSPSNDAFGHRHFASLLKGLIESDQNQPPFSIGLLGTWGSGKSSIKSIYESSLKDQVEKSENTKSKNDQIVPITFNAWRFGGENIKRALLRHVFLDLGGDKTKLNDELFNQVEKPSIEKKSIKEFLWELYDRFGIGLALILVIYLGAILCFLSIYHLLDLKDDLSASILISGSILSPLPIIKMLFDSGWLKFSRLSNVNRIFSPSSSAEEYEDLLLEQISDFKKKKGKACERLVIFIDDLDRLSSEEMVSGLDAIRTFMEIPQGKLPEKLGVVFVISCDEDRLANALAIRQNGNGDLPATVFTQTDARRYLDRIFQFRLEIPPFPKRDMRSFAKEHLCNAIPSLEVDLKSKHSTVDVLVDRMIHIGVSTPRNALQIVNTFLQSWWIASKRETDSIGNNRPGGLQIGSVTNHPVALGAVSAIRVDFPEFYSDLQNEPNIIKRFTEVLIRGLPLNEQPESIQIILQKYISEKNIYEVKPEFRPLRRFISSLRGIQWPRSLQPLLLLSQDPVTRKFGDNALDLYEPFVSGDHHEVLSVLGRQNDSKTLSADQMTLLRDMVEELERETDTRRNNAASVLADLSDRFPAESSRLLLSPLSRRLAESPELRWRLGISKISRAIATTSIDDRKSVACKLIDDLLKNDGEINFRLESGEQPSLHEAIDMVKEACSLILSIRNEISFPQKQEDNLCNWLLSRRVEINEKEQSLPFSDLELWITEHEEWLLPVLSHRYTAVLAEETQQKSSSIIEDDVSRRSIFVFENLWKSGEESRPLIWKQLALFVASRYPRLVSLANNFISKHLSSPAEKTITSFVDQSAQRISKAINEPNEWPLNINAEGKVLVEIATQRSNDIGEAAEESLQDLILLFSKDKSTSELAVLLITSLYNQLSSLANNIVSDWEARLLTDLQIPCLNWLASGLESQLSPEHRQIIINRLDMIHRRDDIPDGEAKRYRKFIDRMHPKGFTTDEMQEHIQKLFNAIGSRHGNPNGYLYQVFPAVPKLLKHSDGESTGKMIHSLFSKTMGDQELFGWLHHWIQADWPERTSENSPYNPEKIFEDAYAFSKSQPNSKWSYGALRTLVSMISLNRVSSEKKTQVLEVACIIWPHHPAHAHNAIESFDIAPTPQQTASIIDNVLIEDEDHCTQLPKTWSVISKRMNKDNQIETCLLILSKPAKGPTNDPDFCFRTWLFQLGDNTSPVLEKLIENSTLNDEQTKRIWLQIESANDQLNNEFFLSIIPIVASLSEKPETFAEMIEFEKSISNKFKTEDEKFELGKALITSFRAASNKSGMNSIAEWIDHLSVDGVLKEIDTPTEEEINILEPHFSKSRYFKAIKKKLKS